MKIWDGSDPEACKCVGSILKRIALQEGINRMRWVYNHIRKYKTHIRRYRQAGSQSKTKLQEHFANDRSTHQTNEKKKKKKREAHRKEHHDKYSQGLTSPALILSGSPLANCVLTTSKIFSANNDDISLSNEPHLSFNDGSVHA